VTRIPLNAGQQAVVESDAARIVVSAGAGSGKTRTLVERFVDRALRLEAAGTAEPMRSILLITFTEKAAGELIERVRTSLLELDRPDLAREVDNAWISTIHGFCSRIVRRHALEVGVDPAFSVLADTEAGLARTAAFEAAAMGLLEDADVRELLDTWSIADLRDGILRGHDSVRSRGLEASDVLAAPSGDLAAALRGLIEACAVLLPEYREQGSSATVLENTALFAAQSAAAHSLLAELADGRPLEDPEVAAALALITETKGARRGGERAKEITAEINEAAADVRRAVLDLRASRWSAAWCRLLEAFAGEYANAKTAAGALDFEDLQLLTRRLWIQRPEAARRYREQFAEVMIDEFQDTNRLQIEATAPIIGSRACFVGDVQQSIYGFRDADVTLLRELFADAEAQPDGEACRLTVNYRTHPGVLGPINAVFSSAVFSGDRHQLLDHEVVPRTMVEWPDGESRVEVIVADKSACPPGEWRAVEARALASRLRAIVDEGKATAGDIVVLMRAGTNMGTYASALQAAGFDVLAPAAGGFYGTREVADARSLLKVMANPLDTEGVIGLLAGGLGGLSDDALFLLAAAGKEHGLWEALAGAGDAGLSSADSERAALMHATVERLRALQGRIRLADALLHAAAVLGPGGGLFETVSGWPNLQKVARLAAQFELTTPADPGALLHYLSEREEYVKKEAVGGTAVEGADAVRLMTVHAAKGLEFPIVAVADLGHGGATRASDAILSETSHGLIAAVRGPKELRPESGEGAGEWMAAAGASREADREEENRVFYVACTRAEQVLLLSGATDMSKPSSGATMIERVLDAMGPAGIDGVDLVVARGEDVGATLPLPDPDGAASALARDASDRADTPQAASCGEAGSLEPLPQPVPLAPPSEMSYTAFALYESCAYRFFSERMLKVGSVDIPKPDDPLTFGSTLHAALEFVARGEEADEERLRSLAQAGGLPAAELPRLVEAVAAVRRSEVAPLLERGRPEVDFALKVGGVVLRGTMDLLVRDGATATVLDYKTGRTWSAEEGRYEAQAEVYAFALLEADLMRVEVRFVHVECGCEQAAFVFTAADRARIRARLEDALARMSAGEFPRLGAFDERYCADCPVSGGLCPIVHPGTGRKARS